MPLSSPLGIVTGLAAEARLARPLGLVAAGGGTPAGAAAAAAMLIARGVTALLSFGFAGGLDPALAPGALVLPHTLVTATARLAIDPELAGRFGTPQGTLFAARAPVLSVEAKAALFAATGACAVDVESEAVAQAAAARRLPFAVLRAVCDPAWRALPPAALAALDATGAIAPLGLLAALARAPAQLPALVLLAHDAQAARAALRRVVSQSAACGSDGSAPACG